MKRVGLAIICCIFILASVSCSSNQNKLEYDSHKETSSNVVSVTTVPNTPDPVYTSSNDIYYFDNQDAELEAKTKNGKLPNIIQVDFDDENQKVDFTKIYLQERGINKEAPDGVSNYNGTNIAEYYIDQENKKICYIFHVISNQATDACFYVTLNLDDMNKIGKLSYRSDEKKETVNETLYDNNGKQTAKIKYQYFPFVPLPLITEYEDMNNYKESIGDVLFRSQKFWLYEKMAQFDESGRMITYDGDIYQPDSINSQSLCSYDSSGRLIQLKSKLTKSDLEEYFDEEIPIDGNDTDKSEIRLSYQGSGLLDSVDYKGSPRVYGTTGQTGVIHYDNEGRMVYEDSYITHGTIYNFYLYHDDEREPWACICIDSMPYSESKKDGVAYRYGNYYSIYLFQNKS